VLSAAAPAKTRRRVPSYPGTHSAWSRWRSAPETARNQSSHLLHRVITRQVRCIREINPIQSGQISGWNNGGRALWPSAKTFAHPSETLAGNSAEAFSACTLGTSTTRTAPPDFWQAPENCALCICKLLIQMGEQVCPAVGHLRLHLLSASPEL